MNFKFSRQLSSATDTTGFNPSFYDDYEYFIQKNWNIY
jgi:hypothetical protein